MLAAFGESPERGGLEIVREHWRDWWLQQKENESGDFEEFWQRSLHEGVIADPAFAHARRRSWTAGRNDGEAASRRAGRRPGTGRFEIVFRPDPTLFDGRFANNGWLQELPKPVTKLTWDNAALMSPKTAQKLGIAYVHDSSSRSSATGGEHGHAFVDVVELTYRGRRIKAPVWIHARPRRRRVTVHLGHGRQHAAVASPSGVGFNAYALRTSGAPWFDIGLEARKLPGRDARAGLHADAPHHGGTRPIRTASLEHFESNPHFAHELTAVDRSSAVLEQVPGPNPEATPESGAEDKRNPTGDSYR